MCGIVGYFGSDKARQYLLEGLERLEYRGYDSAGISILDHEKNRFVSVKTVGRVETLKKRTSHLKEAMLGMGHTRWATHGGVSETNAHPHYAYNGRFIVVHNGVIDNYKTLKADHLKGIDVVNDTNTEVIASLLARFAEKMTVEDAIKQTLDLLEGSFALLILDQDHPSVLYGAKNKSPLILATSNGDWYIASDLLALPSNTERFHVMSDHTWFKLENKTLTSYQAHGATIDFDFEAFKDLGPLAERGEHAHFMLKEMLEQPQILETLVAHHQSHGFDEALVTALKEASSLEIIAAGTSWHAGLVGKHLLEKTLMKPVNVHIASEFAYHPPFVSEHPLFIFISQSGETADLIACHPYIKTKEAPLLTITNVPTSSLSRMADYVLDLKAGPEIAVASTKAYTAQITMIALLCAHITHDQALSNDILTIASSMREFLQDHIKIQPLVKELLTNHHAFYMGRGLDYLTGLEAALKLKEISYIQTEGFAAGELKHGTIALIEEDTPIIALIGEASTSALTRNNIHEVEARGAKALVISFKSLSEPTDAIIFEDVNPMLSPLLLVVPTQLIAYYAALMRGLDIDKPRNLAKSVTVE